MIRSARRRRVTAAVFVGRLLPVLLAAVLAGCSLLPVLAPVEEPPPPPPPRGFTLLSINDVYRIEGLGEVAGGAGERGGLARVRALRRELEEASRRPVLLLHGGDLLGPSLLSRRYGGEQMIDVLNALDGDPAAFDEAMFVTFGNHELEGAGAEAARRLDRRVEESQFRWLAANVWFDDDGREPLVAAPNLTEAAVVTLGGVKIGLFGLAGDQSRPDWVLDFHDAEDTARDAVASLRAAGAELVIAITHFDVGDDLELLEALGDDGPDLVIGGHDHQRTARRGAGGRWVLKADADAASAVVVKVAEGAGGELTFEPGVAELGADTPPPDPEVAARVAGWLERHDREECADAGEPPGCLRRVLGKTRVPLLAEETENRRYETNLGNWIADRLREHFDAGVAATDPGAPLVAFVNAGALRLNRDLPAGYIERRHVEELFPYPMKPRLLRIDGVTLRRVAERAVESWSASGHWLQVSGFAFVHDPDAGTATRLTLLTPEGARPLEDDDVVYAATVEYLVDPEGDQDGYTMLGPDDVVSASETDVRRLVTNELSRRWPEGIAPEVEGRVCNTRREGPCLAVAGSGRPPIH